MLNMTRHLAILAAISAFLFLLPCLALAYSTRDLEGVWMVDFSGSDSRWRVTVGQTGLVTGFFHNRYKTHSFEGQFTVDEEGLLSGWIHRDQTDDTRRRFTAKDMIYGAFYPSGTMELIVEVDWSYQGGLPENETYSSVWARIDFGSDPISDFVNPLGMMFRMIPAGRFMMGSNIGDADEQPVHQVEITKPFYLSVFEVTQLQWQAVMEEDPSWFKGCDECPVDRVSLGKINLFIKRLNGEEGRSKYRLPTEAEWEYASQAGSNSWWHFGDEERFLREYAWYEYNSAGKTHHVGQKKPNAWGLYDMQGNVWEWCQDWYGADYYERSPSQDPQGPQNGNDRVIRGGAWSTRAFNTRSANRSNDDWLSGTSKCGFRLVRDP